MKKQKKPVPPAEAEPVIKKQPLLKRLLFGPERPDLSELEAGSTTILDILSPTAIDTKSRDYIVVDGVFHAYLYITGYGYSTTVGSCWLAPLVEAGEGVNVSFSFTRQNREKILSKIAQTTMLNRSRMRDVGDTRQDYEELDSAITSGLYLKDVMNRQGEDFYYIMAIRRRTLDAYAGIQELAARDDSVLADKISRLIIWYSLQKKDLTEEDKNYLDASLVECYDRYGITFDNASVVDENGAFKEMPIIPDWYNVLLERAETKHLAVVLTRYVTGSAAAMGRRNHISIDNKYIVLDTSGMPDDLILPGIYWAIDVANDIIMNAGGELSALIADELWSLVGAGSNPLAAAYVQEMVKTIRSLGGIAITSTQGMQDLFSLEGGKYGKGILDSSRIKFVMQMEEQEARLIQQILNLSEEEVRQITRFRRGEGLLCIGYNHVPVAFHVTKKEYDAITTSPTDRQARKKGTK